MNTQQELTPAELDAQLLQPNVTTSSEAAALRSTLADLRASSMAVADFRLLAPRPNADRNRTFLMPRWALATATAVMAIALAVPITLRTAHHAAPAPIATAETLPQQAADNTAQDAALLADIQNDLSASVPASLEPLATTSTTSTK